MRRRDALAGLGSLGALAGAGVLVSRGPPSFGDDGAAEAGADDSGDATADDGGEPPFEIETIDAPGSESGTLTLPGANDATLVMFFMPTCGVCQAMMGVLGDAKSTVDDERVTFLGAVHPNYTNTTDLTAAELAEWWAEYDGDWPVGLADTDVVDYYGVYSHPITMVFDADGEIYLDEHGQLDVDVVVGAVEDALEGAASGTETDEPADDEST